MNKQLYTRKIALSFKVALLAGFSVFLSGCGDDAAENKVQETTASTAQTTEQAVKTEQAVEAVETVIASEEVTETDAGFLNKEMILGDPNAPVEIIEYASFTCNHCSTFHNNVMPEIKEKYIDTGKAKVVFRSFMLNGIDMQASIISRCMTEKRYFPFTDMMFKRQTEWYNVAQYQELAANNDAETAGKLFVEATMAAVGKYARQAGLNKAKIDACLANEEIPAYLYEIQQDAIEQYKVNATPTIIVNGNKVGSDYNSVERAIEAALD
ncbi:MAG: thioredoxin domain-containing protein [Emcibacteraceae bacterium]|nr:thioredoxin domain-containing protein [Emcibacteraceae bacterium]